MKKFSNDTIIVNKETWKFLKNYNRTSQGFSEMSDESLERFWNRLQWRNGGANSKTHPIAEDEIRIDRDTFSIRWDTIREFITDNGFAYREDGYIVVGINI